MLKKKQIAMGVLLWVLVFGAFVTLAGIGDFVDRLSQISATELALILSAVGVGVVSMGSALYVIGRSVGLGLGLVESIFLNTSVSLAHNLTPFGQAGGAPIGAAILSQRSDGHYEECLAALSAKDAVSFVPAILVFFFGGLYILLFEQAVPDALRPLFGAFSLFVVVIVGGAIAIYRYPDAMRRLLGRLVGAVNRAAARLPLLPSLEEEELEERLANFTSSFGELAADRQTIVIASALATSAFVAQGSLLWLTLAAVGIDISVALAIFTVQVSLLASGLPLPGGSGGVEGTQVLMLVTIAGVASAPTITAVVLSRGLVFWTPIVLGSITLLVLGVDTVAEEEIV